MDGRQSKHLARVRHLRETFAEANEHRANRLRAAWDDEPDGASQTRPSG